MLQKLKTSALLSKIGVISSYLWFVSTVAFVLVIFYLQKALLLTLVMGKVALNTPIYFLCFPLFLLVYSFSD